MRREEKRKGKEPLIQRANLENEKAKLTPHTNFMAAPKILKKKGTCSWFLLFQIAIMG